MQNGIFVNAFLKKKKKKNLLKNHGGLGKIMSYFGK